MEIFLAVCDWVQNDYVIALIRLASIFLLLLSLLVTPLNPTIIQYISIQSKIPF